MNSPKLHVVALLLCLSLVSCIERNGYYNEGEQSIINLLCETVWVCETKQADETLYTYYDFDSNGTYTQTYKRIDAEGKEKVSSRKAGWSFGDPAFNSIYFDYTYDHWTIKTLDSKKLGVYLIRGEIGTPGYNSEYLEFVANKEDI